MNVRNAIVCGLMAVAASSASAGDSISYIPEIHGVIRPRWEISTRTGESRFQVRYARASVSGHIAPAINYFLHADFCDKGKMKFLDGYIGIDACKGLHLQAGQFRMPFGVATFEAPINAVFADRSYMQKEMCNFRKVGFQAGYTLPIHPSILLQAGIFNAGSITDHEKWSKKYVYCGKATYTVEGWSFTGGALSVRPEYVRLNMLDVAVSWHNDAFNVAAEYMYEHYTGNGHSPAHAYSTYINWHRPVHLGFFNQWSVQGRFDGITRHWDGVENNPDLPARNRITVGSTLTYKMKRCFLDLGLDYQKCFYHSGVEVSPDWGDKVVLELALRF